MALVPSAAEIRLLALFFHRRHILRVGPNCRLEASVASFTTRISHCCTKQLDNILFLHVGYFQTTRTELSRNCLRHIGGHTQDGEVRIYGQQLATETGSSVPSCARITASALVLPVS